MINTYPIVIVEDRYGGSYSGGKWLAIAQADAPIDGPRSESRAQFVLMDGPHGGDMEAMMFWSDPPPWIGVGRTPDEALAAIKTHT